MRVRRAKVVAALAKSAAVPRFSAFWRPQLRRGTAMSEQHDWNDHYRNGHMPWDAGHPSLELQRVLSRNAIQPCRAIEIGCGTGTNCVWLTQQGFDVTGVDVASLAIEQAQQRADAAGVAVRFLVANVLELPDLGGDYGFFF